MMPDDRRKTKKSWHHRTARLSREAYSPKCAAAHCQKAAEYVCEWDHMRGKAAVSGQKLYCAEHAAHFAQRHGICLADLPAVRLSHLEQASRDDWRYADEVQPRTNTKKEDI